MDEILIANYMVFDDLMGEEPYDLVVGDEAWDLDHFLHENPERKRAPFAWMTDFVGWVPMPESGDREAALTGDYNAEMVEQVARYPRLRDASIFVGNPADCVDLPLGAGLPTIRDWTEQHFEFTGHVLGAPPWSEADRPALRQRLGYAPEDQVCVVTVGGSGVGTALLRRVLEAWPIAKRAVPDLRMVVVDRSADRPRVARRARPIVTCPYVGFLPDLTDHLAASRPRGGAGRPDHDDGPRCRRPAVPLPAAAGSLRAERARAAPACSSTAQASASTTPRRRPSTSPT